MLGEETNCQSEVVQAGMKFFVLEKRVAVKQSTYHAPHTACKRTGLCVVIHLVWTNQ